MRPKGAKGAPKSSQRRRCSRTTYLSYGLGDGYVAAAYTKAKRKLYRELGFGAHGIVTAITAGARAWDEDTGTESGKRL